MSVIDPEVASAERVARSIGMKYYFTGDAVSGTYKNKRITPWFYSYDDLCRWIAAWGDLDNAQIIADALYEEMPDDDD